MGAAVVSDELLPPTVEADLQDLLDDQQWTRRPVEDGRFAGSVIRVPVHATLQWGACFAVGVVGAVAALVRWLLRVEFLDLCGVLGDDVPAFDLHGGGEFVAAW